MADIDFPGRTVTFSGVGNVAGMVISGGGLRRQMISNNGTLGHQMPRPAQEYRYPLDADALVLLYSDGISSHWSLDNIQDYRAVIRP